MTTEEAAAVEGARARVAAEKGLSEPQAARLAGMTYEDLSADADALMRAFGPRPGPVLQHGAGGDFNTATEVQNGEARFRARFPEGAPAEVGYRMER